MRGNLFFSGILEQVDEDPELTIKQQETENTKRTQTEEQLSTQIQSLVQVGVMKV